jgi:hypothetical protein
VIFNLGPVSREGAKLKNGLFRPRCTSQIQGHAVAPDGSAALHDHKGAAGISGSGGSGSAGVMGEETAME